MGKGRLERLRQEGRVLGNGGLPFRDWSLGEDDWMTRKSSMVPVQKHLL